jgi:hypothetical protein
MPSSTAERVRIHRKRHRNGMRFVRVLLHENEIDSLVHEGYLKQERRHLRNAIQDAINTFVCHRLGPPLE